MSDRQEEARLDALYQLKLLDTPPSESFDRITRMASQIFDLPVAAISLTDRDRQWFKSRVGIDDTSIARTKAPCAEVAESMVPLVIEDFLADPFYADSPLGVTGTRFYAGVPLVTSDGFGLGSLCVLGRTPRLVTDTEMAALTDLAAMVMAQIELQHAFGRIDPISGMPTRNQFREDIGDLARDHPGEERLAVVVELAREGQMSKILRVRGGSHVDELIREACRWLRSALGPDRTAYHVGPAQFAFLAPPDVERASYLQELQAALELMQASSSARFVTSVAVGVRPFALGMVTADDVLRGAVGAAQDARLAEGSVALYSSATDIAHRREYALLQDFGMALEAGDQLRLVYQPRIDLATRRCIGAEALLRWRHPRFGEVMPAEFIPLVETTSFARTTTQWVLDTALDQLRDWRQVGATVSMSINISAVNLGEADLTERIRQGLLARQIPARDFEVELTESAIMDQPEQALAKLKALSATGVGVAIDDFGTGHSSLAYLQRLPTRILKIDRTFVRNLTEAAGPDFVLVKTMTGLAHMLDYRVVAEGVETGAAAAVLAAIGCQEAQGYWFSRPVEAAAFLPWLRDRAAESASIGR